MDAVDLEEISFVMAYTVTGRQVYCLSGLFLHGADPCGKSARPDFFLNFDSFLRNAIQRPTRNIVRITDTTVKNHCRLMTRYLSACWMQTKKQSPWS